MSKLIVVEKDRVSGTDLHSITGNATNPAPPPATVPYQGTAQFDYQGKMTGQLCPFVNINHQPIALKTSTSSLDPGEKSAPAGKHSGPMGRNFIPSTPIPVTASLQITDPIGTGNPSAGSGSLLLKADGVAVLLDNDKIDTCDCLSTPMNSKVSAGNQDFVRCFE